MVNKLCLETDVKSFSIISIILLQLLIFSSRYLFKLCLLSQNNPKCFWDELRWTWLPLKVNLRWSSEFTLRENNTSVACLLGSGLKDIFHWWQNLRADLLRGPVLDSISPDFNKRKFWMYKQCKTTNISHGWSIQLILIWRYSI